MGKIKKCADCSRYTLEATCPECGGDAGDPEPPAFSFPDRYGEYRRRTKQAQDGQDTDGA